MISDKTINRDILRITIPAIATNITVPLLGISDTVIAGHLDGNAPLGAIAVGSMMINVIFWLFGFLRMGTTGLTAQEFGNRNPQGCRIIFSRAFLLAALSGILILLLLRPLSHLLLAFIKPDPMIADLASDYFSICILSAPAILSTMAVQGWFLGMQTSFYPMIVSISVNIANILLSLLFVFVCRTGFIGLAYGSMAANWFGLFLALFLARRFLRGAPLWCRRKDLLRRGALSRFFHVNSDIFFRSACIMAVSLSVTAFGARQGVVILGANAVMMQFFHFFSYFMDGFAFAAEAQTGRFAGAHDIVNLHRSLRILLLWSALIALIFFFVYLFGWRTIISLITDSPQIIECIADYRVWVILIPPLTVAAFIFDGAYIGITATRTMLLATLAAALLFFSIALIHLQPHSFGFSFPGNNRLWAAFMTYLIARGAILAVLSKRMFSRNHIIKTICSNS